MIEYDPHDWKGHLFSVRGTMVREILARVATCVSWTVAVVVYHRYVGPVGMPVTVHSLVGVALGLLLVFRTNASYDRYWEGRRLWGSIINESRNLARASDAFMAGDDLETRHDLARWTVAFAYACMNRLRNTKGLGPGAEFLPHDQTREVLSAPHVPMAVASRISQTLVDARNRGMLSDYLLAALDQNVQQLMDYLGGCERIRRTPLPFVYVVHLRRALILYCYTLPFALVRDYGWGTIAGTFIVAYIFFGIEEIGVEIEDPFGSDTNDLPIEDLCATIDANLAGFSGEPLGGLSGAKSTDA